MEKRTSIVLVLAAVAIAVAAIVGAGNKDSKTTTAATDTPAQTAPATAEETKVPEAIAKAPVMPKTSGTPPKALETKDIVVGEGTEAKSGDNVTMRYTGVLWDKGTEFDSSWKRSPNEFPFTLGQGAVIPCWDKGVVGMKVGGRRELVCPPDIAYGSQGQGSIPPNSTLVFVVDLIKVG
jgi:peptidylprolyl isomerase